MNKQTLENVSGLLAKARNVLDEMEVSEWDEDTKENWIYEIELVETDIDVIIEGIHKGKF